MGVFSAAGGDSCISARLNLPLVSTIQTVTELETMRSGMFHSLPRGVLDRDAGRIFASTRHPSEVFKRI